MRNDEYDYNEEMCSVASTCRNFSRRRDVNSFSMVTYKSCENCNHLTPNNRCGLNQSDKILFSMDTDMNLK